MRRHLYFYTLVESPPGPAHRILEDDPAQWLPAPAARVDDGFQVDLHAEGALPRGLSHHTVVVDVGPAVGEPERLLRSIRWRSASAPGLFPVFDGDLELVALSGGNCQLSLMGTYRPPLSVAGGAGDALLGHHVAEACVRRFVLDAAERMVGVSTAAVT
jgi:hypothetical protein